MGENKIIVDTNVLISAIGWNGKPRQIFNKILDGSFQLIISKKQFSEIKRVLDYQRLNFSKEQKADFLEMISKIAVFVDTKIELNIIKEDKSDNMFLECAVETGTKIIISGDPHLLKLKKYENIKIVNANTFLNEIK